MCWVAIDRAIRLATKRSFPAPLARWYAMRDTIYKDVFDRFLGLDAARVHPARRRHHAGRRRADDAARPFRVADRPAMALDAARDRARAGERLAGLSLSPRGRILRRAHGGRRHVLDVLLLVCRVPLSHGGFAQGTVLLRKDARVRKSPGVVWRELGPQAQHLGNFPQAFTHLALISAAFDLDRRLSAAGHAGDRRPLISSRLAHSRCRS